MKQTAVEWLIEQFETIVFYSEEAKENTIKQAQAMFEEQIIEAYRKGVEEDVYVNPLKTGTQYFNETYKQQTP